MINEAAVVGGGAIGYDGDHACASVHGPVHGWAQRGCTHELT